MDKTQRRKQPETKPDLINMSYNAITLEFIPIVLDLEYILRTF